jgi:putative DNA primase/helicase
MNDFIRANNVGIGQVRSWLPSGRQDGDEWVALNPMRNDNHEGSFRINLKTGKWADFAEDGASGPDAVSLYAYLNHSSLEQQAKNYKNIEGGIQVEAAKEILIKYDPGYFPSDSDNFTIPKRKRGENYWEGWTQELRGLENPPELDLAYHERNWGKAKATWYFQDKGKTIMAVARFVGQDGKKDDRPFTLWHYNGETKWRAKNLPEKRPLWNKDELEERQNAPVILTEGQKAASVIKDILTDYVCVGWYGGCNAIDKTDWTPLAGREIWFPFDADTPGRKILNKVKKIAENNDIILHPVHPPLNVPKGWDIADAVTDGWTAEKIEEFLKKEPSKIETEKKYLDDENPYQFDILGYSGENIMFYPYGAKKVVKHKSTGINKSVMISLMDRAEWGNFYRKDDGGIAWDAAMNDLIRRAEQKPVFDPARVRGTGAWIDNGIFVVNDGEYLWYNGEQHELHDSPGHFVYERGKSSPYNVTAPMSTEESTKLIDILCKIKWKKKIDPSVMAGWILLAPFGGALRWRPHVWLTGAKGGGKSWILENIVYPMVGYEFGITGSGSSTTAGVRSGLSNSSLAAVLDEMETDNPKHMESIDQILRAFREGSSGAGGGAATLHGTQDGEGRRWIVSSMAMCASIGAAMRHGADKSRFTVCELYVDPLEKKDIREQRFQDLQESVQIINNIWSHAFVARTFKLFDQIKIAIEVMTAQATDILGARRDGDQLGTLMAGAWMVINDKAPTAAEARMFLEYNNVSATDADSLEKSDEELCLDEILSMKIDVSGHVKTTIGSVISYWYETELCYKTPDNFSPGEWPNIRLEIEQYGIKLINKTKKIQIATGHPAIRKGLEKTAWPIVYDTILGRLPCCADDVKGPARFAGLSKRYREIDAELLFKDGTEEDVKQGIMPF